MEIKNGKFKQIELPDKIILKENAIVKLSPYGTVIVKDILLQNGKIIFNFQFNNEIVSHDYNYVSKNIIILYKNEYEIKLIIGDWTGLGHGNFEEYNILSNYNVEKLRQAYKDSCKLTGLTFSANEDYTGLGKNNEPWRFLLIKEGSDAIDPKACKILESFCLIKKDDWDEEGDCWMALPDPDDVSKLIMDFIALSMPKDFFYSFSSVKFDYAPSINGEEDGELNAQFGYGIY